MMQPLVQMVSGAPSIDELAERCRSRRGFVYLRTGSFDSPGARFSIVGVDPFLTLTAWGSTSMLVSGETQLRKSGNPWRILEPLLEACSSRECCDLPFPAGAMIGFWGYDLKNLLEPRLQSAKVSALRVPDCFAAFYGSLLIRDHQLQRTMIVSTGVGPDGSRSSEQARRELDAWLRRIEQTPSAVETDIVPVQGCGEVRSWMSDELFMDLVNKAQRYIRAGDIYQVNLARSWSAPCAAPWDLFKRLAARSPAPYSAFLDCGSAAIVSSSPEQFLQFNGVEMQSRPIKGTRPRHADRSEDARLAHELRSSPKENAELLMITDLLRNDLGRVCQFGSIHVPELSALERYSHVQHLVSTVQGRLRPGVSHLAAMEACFPGGSITGAPKIRAMQIIDELEPVARGPYTGALGHFGFNRRSHLSILIRTAVCAQGQASFHAGAGIVADSRPEAECEETRLKAQAILDSITCRTEVPLPTLP